MKISVFGAGAWGTAIASHMARLHEVRIWARDASALAQLEKTRENKRYLPGISLVGGFKVQPSFEGVARFVLDAPRDDQLWVLATPMSALRESIQALCGLWPVDQWPALVWLCKGFEATSGLLAHQIAQEVVGRPVGGTLTGPSFADEVARGLPCALTAASPCESTRSAIVRAAHHHAMRVYEIEDVIGAEVGGAVKNIMALATGISDGMKLGLNARAALMTRGMAEIARLAVALGAQAQTLNGLSGMGDLLLTCTGDLSRNRRVGLKLAEGLNLDQILQDLGQVAEGVKCAPVVLDLAKRVGVEMPITAMVNEVLFNGLSAREGAARLLAREAKSEL